MKNILTIGESSHGTHLVELKEIFSRFNNLDKIFLEKSVSYQPFIKEYIEKQTINKRLEKFFANALKEGNDMRSTLLFILDYAREKDIPVICIDSSKVQTDEYNKVSAYGRWFLKGESRDEDMFNNFVNNYNKSEKVIIFCGAKHLSEEKHFRTGTETLGARLKNKFGDNYEKIILK